MPASDFPVPLGERTVQRTVRGPNSRYVTLAEGQPGGQQYALKPAGYALVERMARDGRDLASIAKALGVSSETFRVLRLRDPPTREALDRGRAALGDELQDILLSHARKGITIAAIFLAKARCGWREGEAMPGGNITNNTQINIAIPERMSNEDFRALISGVKKDGA